MTKVLVTGAGGFIGHHLVTFLKQQGYWVRGVDQKTPGVSKTDADEFLLLDLRRWENCLTATAGIEEVYALAADMGGMGFISAHHAEILHNNSLINIHTLDAARENGVKRYLYSSSACVYPEYKQTSADVVPLKEEDAYPAQPQDAYGWEKLVTERLCTHYREDYGLQTRIVQVSQYLRTARYLGRRPRESAAAMCRKIAIAKLTRSEEIEIWGDGKQTRSFCYIDDCVAGIHKLMRSDYPYPLNLGQDRMVTVDELADLVGERCRNQDSQEAHRWSSRSARAQFRQYPPARGSALATGNFARGWSRAHLSLDRGAGASRAAVFDRLRSLRDYENRYDATTEFLRRNWSPPPIWWFCSRAFLAAYWVRVKLWRLGYPVLPMGSVRILGMDNNGHFSRLADSFPIFQPLQSGHLPIGSGVIADDHQSADTCLRIDAECTYSSFAASTESAVLCLLLIIDVQFCRVF